MTILMKGNPGLPDLGGGQSHAHRLAGDELEIRRHFLLPAVGIAVTFALFLALPFMQVVSTPVAPPLQPVESFARPIPKEFVPPPIPPAPEKPLEKPADLKPEFDPIPYERLVATPNPFGPGIPSHGITWDPGELVPDYYLPDQLDRPPSAIHTVAPDIPRGSRYSGTVVLEFIVTPQGTVTGIKVISSSNPAFDRPATIALAKWKFDPGVKDNTPVPTRMRLPIRFNLAN